LIRKNVQSVKRFLKDKKEEETDINSISWTSDEPTEYEESSSSSG